jgi:hypothetical protein
MTRYGMFEPQAMSADALTLQCVRLAPPDRVCFGRDQLALGALLSSGAAPDQPANARDPNPCPPLQQVELSRNSRETCG